MRAGWIPTEVGESTPTRADSSAIDRCSSGRRGQSAIAMGLDGFILEMSYRKVHSDERFNQVKRMLDAARAVDPGFRILLGPGFPKESNATPDELAETLLSYTGHPAVFRLPDGRVPIATFYPERPASSGGKPLSWWCARR
jgi:hypothetical protein